MRQGSAGVGRIVRAAAVLALACAPGLPARAHDASFSRVDLRRQGERLDLTLTVHRADAARVLGVTTPESLRVPTYLGARAARLASVLLPRIELIAGGRRLEPRFLSAEPLEDSQGIALRFAAGRSGPAEGLFARARLFPDDPQHETFLEVWQDGRLIRQDVLTADRTETKIVASRRSDILAVVVRFVGVGVHHIFIGPDHVLFILGLILLGGSALRVLRIATCFTLAHSLTLVIATLGWFNPPGRIIEPLIALSVAWVGFESLRGRRGGADRRGRLAFGFGLVHGFGFAGVLREFGLPPGALGASLFAFNLGVEIGQAAIVLAAAPLLGLLRARSPRWEARVITVGCCGVILAGAFWFVQRVGRIG